LPNPFLLRGFEFLAFYLVVGILINWGLRKWIRNKETETFVRKPQMADPYQIAYLRGGEHEALSIATIALIDRGLLIAEGETLRTKDDLAIQLVNRPIEKAILKRYVRGGNADEIFTDTSARAACDEYKKTLTEYQLLADTSVYRRRLMPALIAVGGLLLIAGTKIVIALSQGRHNLAFLVILTIVFSIAAVVACAKRITGRGQAMLDDLKILFDRLRRNVKSLRTGGQTNEAALVAAIFGISILPSITFPFVNKLYPNKSSGDGGSSCSSSSSSCGSSCGGGGCGGGCGG